MNGTLYAIGEIVVFMLVATVIGYLIGRGRKSREWPADASDLVEAYETIEELEGERDDLTASLADARLQIAAAAREDAGTESHEVAARLADREGQIEQLEHRLDNASVTIDELRQERDQLQASLDAATEAADRASPPDEAGAIVTNDELMALRAEVARLETDVSDRDSQIAQLEADVAQSDEPDPATEELRSELAQREAEVKRLEEVVSDAARLEAALAEKDGRIEQLEAALLEDGALPPAPAAPDEPSSIGFSSGGGSFSDTRIEFDGFERTD